MKISPYLLCAVLALGAASSPCFAVNIGYMPASRQLAHLESAITTLSSAQKQQALKIYQNLTDIMNSIPADQRPEKGMQSRQDARAAIRAILTPDQQKVYDTTPGYQGGGSVTGTPAMQARNRMIRSAINAFVRGSSQIAAAVGNVQKIRQVRAVDNSESFNGSPPQVTDGYAIITVTGDHDTQSFKISWAVSSSGSIQVTSATPVEN